MFSYLLGQESGTTSVAGLFERLLNPSVLPFLIPIAAILVGGAIAMTKLLIRHRERIAAIASRTGWMPYRMSRMTKLEGAPVLAPWGGRRRRDSGSP